MANLVYRHHRITRLTHWIDALALMILFMSGLMIFNAHPHLYWGSTSAPEKAFFSIGAPIKMAIAAVTFNSTANGSTRRDCWASSKARLDPPRALFQVG
jgi:cytochrome b subunit of formate dehydrogenase